jgi:hypothetical protein
MSCLLRRRKKDADACDKRGRDGEAGDFDLSGCPSLMRSAENPTLLKALVALAPACVLLAGAAVTFPSRKTLWSFLQVVGAGGLAVVALTHVAEALQLFPWMGWGDEHSAGQYIDLGGAALGLILFPIGYLVEALRMRSGQ